MSLRLELIDGPLDGSRFRWQASEDAVPLEIVFTFWNSPGVQSTHTYTAADYDASGDTVYQFYLHTHVEVVKVPIVDLSGAPPTE